MQLQTLIYLEIIGHGGHRFYPDKTKDLIVAAANLIMSLQTVVTRNVSLNELGIVSVDNIEVVGHLMLFLKK